MVFDHTSVLKLMEWPWGLAPLTPRDASSDISNLAKALNFTNPDATVPSLSVPQTPLIALPANPGRRHFQQRRLHFYFRVAAT